MAAAAAAASPAPSQSSSSVLNKCFNLDCSDLKSKRGWRLRSGEFAELCDRCASAYEEGRFCETFHLNAAGWRCCESCGKRVHCGCIVSCNAFLLLDAGGIECVGCVRHNIRAPNPTWVPPFAYNEIYKDHTVKRWSQIAGSGPVPWRQAPSLFNSSVPHSELHPRTLYEIGRLNTDERSSGASIKKGRTDEISESGNAEKKSTATPCGYVVAGSCNEEKPGSSLGITQKLPSLREDQFTLQHGLDMRVASLNKANGQTAVSGTPLLQPSPALLGKQFHGNLHNGVDSSGEIRIRNGRPRVDARGRSQLLPRYWPRFTNEELQQISENSKSLITPLFEKMLSASDAGRIGRLVLPKKCAEAYFPLIENPEGLPLKVQDSKGKEWIFQFRFWPNNNSRMYVLEGVTPCIQNMRLQAGDIVTFSRLEPEGKLVMGFRKASSLSDQDNDTRQTGNGVSLNRDAEMADPSPWSKVDKSGYIAKDVLEAKSSIRKRKSSTLGSKSKRLRIENEDMIELKLTWEEAQGLLRPPPDHTPSVVVIEGFEFEEYKDEPIVGKPTIFATDASGCKLQWVQCEDCLKWRKLPTDALLPSKWTCSANTWDSERSLCSAPQELTSEQLKELLPSTAASNKMKGAKQDIDNDEALEGLDTLLKAANLAILGENENSSQATTKHPRHRPGCSCIVCIQPPSGKGSKHKHTCTCNVCLTVKRRFKTLMMKRERKQSEKEAESTKIMPQQDKTLDDSGSGSPNKKRVVSEGSEDDPNRNKSSPFKGQIDLNIQPEREEELSPGSDSGRMVKMLQDSTERYLRQQRFMTSIGENIPAGNAVDENVNSIMLISNHEELEKDRHAPSPMRSNMLSGSHQEPEKDNSTPSPMKSIMLSSSHQEPEKDNSANSPMKSILLSGSHQVSEKENSAHSPVKSIILSGCHQEPEKDHSAPSSVKSIMLSGTLEEPEKDHSAPSPMKSIILSGTHEEPQKDHSAPSLMKSIMLSGSHEEPEKDHSAPSSVKSIMLSGTHEEPEKDHSAPSPMKSIMLSGSHQEPGKDTSANSPMKSTMLSSGHQELDKDQSFILSSGHQEPEKDRPATSPMKTAMVSSSHQELEEENPVTSPMRVSGSSSPAAVQ